MTVNHTSVEDFAKSSEQVIDLAKHTMHKALKNQEFLSAIWDDLVTISRMLMAWARGYYEALPWRSVLAIIAALLYFVNPFDAIPDFIVGTGFIDDAAVIGLVIQSLRRNIDQFKLWEQQQPSYK